MKEQERLQRALAASEARLREIELVSEIGSWELTLADGSLLWSEGSYRVFALEPFSITPSAAAAISAIHSADREEFLAQLERARNGQATLDLRHRIVLTGGIVKWVHARAVLVRGDDGTPLRLVGTVQDVTRECEAEEASELASAEAARLSRLYEALSALNKSVARELDRQQLLESICRVLVEIGGFRMAWIGEFESSSRSLVPVASAGTHTDYLDGLRLSVNDPRESDGPGIAAFRSGRPVIVNDVAHDDRMAPWRREATRRGFMAVATFPIDQAGRPAGVLAVYAERPGFFQQRETALLEEAAASIAFGLENVERDRQRTALAASLDLQNVRLREAQSVAQVGSWERDLTTGALHWSMETYRLFGYDPLEVEASFSLFLDRLPSEDRTRLRDEVDRSIAQRTEGRLEHAVVLAGAERRIIEERWRVVCGPSGGAERLIGTCQDITERRNTANQLRALALRLESAQQEERAAIAREVHDHLGQLLTALKMDVSRLGRMPGHAPPAAALIAEVSSGIDGTLQETRSIARMLHPQALDDLGLVAAVELHATQVLRRAGLQGILDLSLHDEAVDKPRAGAVYRILQESLTNVVRHAGATSVTVRLAESDGGLLLEVIDDGRGLPDPPATSATSLGLVGMRERAMVFDGELSVSTLASGGTMVRLRLPLDRSPSGRSE